MSFLNSLNITGSALTAQRYRMDIISQNIANADTTKTADGTPYKRQQVVLREREFKDVLKGEMTSNRGGGVYVEEVIENENPSIPVYDPTHPHADENGYVMMPNVNKTEEMVDLMAASRAYEANITALSVVKAMAMKALEIGK
ncbi:MAG: flagellar basal body rod protein FlgC [Oscillospiraceae bacterium]